MSQSDYEKKIRLLQGHTLKSGILALSILLLILLSGFNQNRSPALSVINTQGKKLPNSLQSIIMGSPNRMILTSFNLSYNGNPAGHDLLFTRDLIQLRNGSYAMLVLLNAKKIYYLGMSVDGWNWNPFIQINSKESEFGMRLGKLFELPNGSLGLFFLHYHGFDQALNFRLLNSTGKLGPFHEILPPFDANIYTVLQTVTLPNQSFCILYHNKQRLYMVIIDEFLSQWNQPIDITPPLGVHCDFTEKFDVEITPNNQLVVTGLSWNESSDSSLVYLTAMDINTLNWYAFQELPFPPPHRPYVTLQLLSNGNIAVVAGGKDLRFFLSFGTNYREWTAPIPFIPLETGYLADDKNVASKPFLVELPNNALLFSQSRKTVIEGEWTRYTEIRIVPANPSKLETPLVLHGPSDTHLLRESNDSLTLYWHVWDDDPGDYWLYMDGLLVKEGKWNNNTPITYTAPESYFTNDKNFTLRVVDGKGHFNAVQWGNIESLSLPSQFPVLIFVEKRTETTNEMSVGWFSLALCIVLVVIKRRRLRHRKR